MPGRVLVHPGETADQMIGNIEMDMIKVLLVEDNPVDALCLKEALAVSRATSIAMLHVETLADAQKQLGQGDFHAVILDLGLPDSQGIDTFVQLKDASPDIPVVVLSGLDDETLAIEAVREGAQDYLVKDEWDSELIIRSLLYAIERHRLLVMWKQANESSQKANRALSVLSECNQLLVRATEEQKFLKDICRILVDHGGYRMAWIGFALRDRDKTVQPVAIAGYEEGYLQAIKITWSEDETGQGPTGTAIRTGATKLNRNSLENESYAPWRTEALDRGYASSIALPLTAEGGIIGALTIYAGGPDAFHAEEVSLLNQLADDLSYGIGALRMRAAKEKAESALRESEKRFRAIFEAAQDYMYLQDRSLKLTLVNPAVEQLFGLSAPAITGKKYDELFGVEGTTCAGGSEQRVLLGESIEEECTRTINGTPMTFLETRIPLRDDAGHIVGILTIAHDITERKRLQSSQPKMDVGYASKAMRDTLKMVHLASQKDATILLLGESGSGKDHLARYIHSSSPRSSGPYFSVNCAAIPAQLAESELFGHEQGAFTGAQRRKRGLVELAEGGTLLLNEIGELTLPLQAKLLTFLDSRSFVRVGGQKPVRVSARLIAATHRDLQEEVKEKRFLEPLFYRLSVFPIRVPSLRERKEDIPVLVQEIMAKLAAEIQLKELPVVDSSALEILQYYDWPGNVRELRNVLERSLMLWHGGAFSVDVPGRRESSPGWRYVIKHRPENNLQDVIDEVAHSLCRHALGMCDGNKKKAAEKLGISRDTLYRYLKKMNGRRSKLVLDDDN